MSVEFPEPLKKLQDIQFFHQVISKAQYYLRRSVFDRDLATEDETEKVRKRILSQFVSINPTDGYLWKVSEIIQNEGAEKVEDTLQKIFQRTAIFSPRSQSPSSSLARYPKCLQTLDGGMELAKGVLVLKYLTPARLKHITKKIENSNQYMNVSPPST